MPLWEQWSGLPHCLAIPVPTLNEYFYLSDLPYITVVPCWLWELRSEYTSISKAAWTLGLIWHVSTLNTAHMYLWGKQQPPACHTPDLITAINESPHLVRGRRLY